MRTARPHGAKCSLRPSTCPQVAAFLSDKGNTLKLSYAHSVNPTTTVGAEVTRKLASGDTGFALGYARKLASGALAKMKVRQRGGCR